MKCNYRKLLTGKALLISLMTFILIVSCDNDSAGPCAHIYEEPILSVISAKDVDTQQGIDRIELKSIKIDGIDADLNILLDQSSNINRLDSTLICNIPCAFGTQTGEYSFMVSAEGFRDSLYTLDVQYKYSEGGCPSRSWGSQEMMIELAHQ